jgi:hypothetical protein
VAEAISSFQGDATRMSTWFPRRAVANHWRAWTDASNMSRGPPVFPSDKESALRTQRDVLPIPGRPYTGVVTYDAKGPDTSSPRIKPLPVWGTSPLGPFDAWPVGGGGFEHFYGFIGGETNQYAPALDNGTVPIDPIAARRRGTTSRRTSPSARSSGFASRRP